ncbi:uncharacterized protein MEPE_03001 [Melanopsichium pennsylvanicum]|uniref:Uncharacterized protein n=1 Tax=Melanopsichium pennsylvanicum TaxID=63383 RepID=A0AAJ4XL40_9BASI|nr:uncharacterized protein MEPE_03001 [Melanopsichium pennsylvanicum]
MACYDYGLTALIFCTRAEGCSAIQNGSRCRYCFTSACDCHLELQIRIRATLDKKKRSESAGKKLPHGSFEYSFT